MDLQKIRYKGDLKDTIDLYEDYKVKQIIDSHEEILKEHNTYRDNLLANSVRLTSVISPRISSSLKFSSKAEVKTILIFS